MKTALLNGVLAAALMAGAASAWGAEEVVTACFDEADRSGYGYLDTDGVWRGAAVDLVKAMAQQAGLRLVLQPLPWARCLRQAKATGPEAVDFAFYASVNPQRLADYAFLGPIHQLTGGVWFVTARSDLPHTLTSYQVLGQHRMCGVSGSNYAWLEGVGVSKSVDAGAHSLRAVVTKLLLGRCDYLLSTAELRASAERHGIARADMEALSFAPYPEASVVGYYLLFNKGQARHAPVLEAFTAAFAQLSRTGAVERIYREYGFKP
ncbi:substrate-binding periplasmic protein [Roseateles sp. NT4]|uniref:substrate-binding periplasmic protein n=1 Tax=Roseateles sp. NT4 TaxID=3453715 RepID=UPI003EEBF5B7